MYEFTPEEIEGAEKADEETRAWLRGLDYIRGEKNYGLTLRQAKELEKRMARFEGREPDLSRAMPISPSHEKNIWEQVHELAQSQKEQRPMEEIAPNMDMVWDEAEPVVGGQEEPADMESVWGEATPVGKELDNGETDLKLGFMDKWREIKEEGVVPFVPFLSGAKEVKDIAQIASSAYRLNNDSASQEDKERLIAFVQKANKDTDFWYKTLDVVSAMPAFMGEFILTSGIYSAGRKVGTEIATKSIKKLLGKKAEGFLQKKLGKLTVKIAGGIAGGTVQTPIIGLPRIISGTIERSMPKLKLTKNEIGEIEVLASDSGEDLLLAATKSLGDQWVETVSEHSGGLFGELGGYAKSAAIKAGLFSAFLKVNAKMPVNKAISLFKKAGYHGVLSEMGEERIGEVGRAALGIQEYKLPTKEQLAVELVSFSVPGVIQKGVSKVFGKEQEKEETAKEKTDANKYLSAIKVSVASGEIDAKALKAIRNNDLTKQLGVESQIDEIISKVETGIKEEVQKPEEAQRIVEGKVGKEVAKEPYQMSKAEWKEEHAFEDINPYAHKYNVEEAIKEGKIDSHPDYPELTKATVKEPVKFIGMQKIEGEPSQPLVEATTGKMKGGRIDYDAERHEIVNLAEYEKAVGEVAPEKADVESILLDAYTTKRKDLYIDESKFGMPIIKKMAKAIGETDINKAVKLHDEEMARLIKEGKIKKLTNAEGKVNYQAIKEVEKAEAGKEPITAYHGTNEQIKTFKENQYFTTSKKYAEGLWKGRKGANVVETEIQLNNPKVITQRQIENAGSDKLLIAEAKNNGHDGFVNEAGTVFIVFDPKNVKIKDLAPAKPQPTAKKAEAGKEAVKEIGKGELGERQWKVGKWTIAEITKKTELSKEDLEFHAQVAQFVQDTVPEMDREYWVNLGGTGAVSTESGMKSSMFKDDTEAKNYFEFGMWSDKDRARLITLAKQYGFKKVADVQQMLHEIGHSVDVGTESEIDKWGVEQTVKFFSAKPQTIAPPAEKPSDLAGSTIEGEGIVTPTPKVEKISITDKSVRDLPQQVILSGNTIKIVSKYGRKKVGEYSFGLDEWEKAKRGPSANEEYNFRQLVGKKFRESGNLDESPEGEAITERLIDSHIRGIKNALNKSTEEVTPTPKEAKVEVAEKPEAESEDRYLAKQKLDDISRRMLKEAKRKVDIDYDRTIETARKIASLEDAKLSQEHIAEAIQYAIDDFAIIGQVPKSKQETVDGRTFWRLPNGQEADEAFLERIEEVFGVKPKEVSKYTEGQRKVFAQYEGKIRVAKRLGDTKETERLKKELNILKAKPIEKPEVKEPWQMTIKEILEQSRQKGLGVETKPNLYGIGKQIISEGMTISGIPANEIPGWEKILESHKRDVGEAYKRGETIPANVLAEYPELTKEAKPAEKPLKPEPQTGMAWIKNQQKPIMSAREITSGKNKGKYEVTLTRGRDAEGKIIPGVKRVVEKDAIVKMPEEVKEAKPAEKPAGEGKKFATKATVPQDTITRKDLKEIFSGMKNIRTGQDADGNFYFGVEGKPKVTIYEVNHIDGYIDTSSGRIPVGSFLKDTMQLKTGGIGATADIGTAWHEFHHYLEGNGILSSNDIKALNASIALPKGKSISSITEEDRATYVGDNLYNWQSQKNLRIKRILKKIADFMNAVWEFVSRTRSARGVLRDISSGKILSEKEVSGINQFAQDVSFSLKKAVANIRDNPKFVKWFKKSKVLNTDGNPLIVYRGDYRVDKLNNVFRIIEIDEGGSGGVFWTSAPDIASSYSENKPYYLDEAFDPRQHTQVTTKGRTISLAKADRYLNSKQRETIKKAVLSYGENPATYEYDFSGKDPSISKGTWEQYLKQNKGRHLDTLYGLFMESGFIVESQEFIDIIKDLNLFEQVSYDSPYAAHSGVTPAYLKIENPFNVTESTDKELEAIEKIVGKDDITLDGIIYSRKTKSPETVVSITKEFREALQKLGYDGIKDEGGHITEGDKHDVFITFNPTQIKSIFNTGAFDPTNPDIRYAMAGEKAIGAPTGALAKAQEMLKRRDDIRSELKGWHLPKITIATEGTWKYKIVNGKGEWLGQYPTREKAQARIEEIRNLARETKGLSEKEVWKETGWLKGAEGKWKWEIDDSGAKIKEFPDTSYRVPLEDILTHPELYSAYPELRKVPFTVFSPATNQDSKGMYNKKDGILINYEYIDETNEILLHEVSHIIQEIEGFAKGGSAAGIAQSEHLKKFGFSSREDMVDAIKELKAKYKEVYNIWVQKAFAKRYKGQAAESRELLDEWQGIEKRIKELKEYDYDTKEAYEKYQKLAGEIEARSVAERAKLTAEQRRETMPYEAQGIPREDWIVTDGKGTSFSVELKETIEQEALKYKSADEFVDSQPTLYHGTDRAFEELDFPVERKSQGIFGQPAPTGKVISLAENRKDAEFFASWRMEGTPRIIEVKISSNAKIFDFTQVSGKNYEAIWDELYRIDKEIAEDIDTANMTVQQAMNYQPFIENLKKAGYDGIRFLEPEDKGTTIGIINKDVIKTKAQLTDIWNKAQKEQPKFATKEGLSKQKGSTLDNEGMELNYTVYIDRYYGTDKTGKWNLISNKTYYDEVGLNLKSDTLKGLKDEITKVKEQPKFATKPFETKPGMTNAEIKAAKFMEKFTNDYKKSANPKNPESVDPTKKPTSKELKSYINENRKLITEIILAHHPKNLPEQNILQRIFQSPEFWKHPVLKQLYEDVFANRRELYYNHFNELNTIDVQSVDLANGKKITVEHDTVIEASRDIAKKGVDLASFYLKGKVSKEYELLNQIIDEADVEGILPEKFEKILIERGVPDEVIVVWKLQRLAYDKTLEDKLIKPLKDLQDEITEREAFTGKEQKDRSVVKIIDEKGNEQLLSLRDLIDNISKYKGSYAPRIRKQGRYAVRATKGAGLVKSRYFNTAKTKTAAILLKNKLKKDGWDVKPIVENSKIPESTYQAINTIEVAKFIEASAEKMNEGELSAKANFIESLMEEAANLIRARGYRAHGIHRQKELVEGYILDSTERLARYLSNVSAGLAKAETARKATKVFFGEYVNGKRVGGVSPTKETRVYEVGIKYIKEQLRNTETADRVIDTIKSIATFRWLGFSLRSMGANLTAMATTVPASLHAYAGDGKISFAKISMVMGKASKDYSKIMLKKSANLSIDEQRFMDEIQRQHLDAPQYTREAMGSLRDAYGSTWAKTMRVAMYMFGKSEQWMRGTTMLAGYRIARIVDKNISTEQASKKAMLSSNRAHGVYDRSTLPIIAQGNTIGEQAVKMGYTYLKFSHTYLQTMMELGFNKKNIRAFLWQLIVPSIIGGAKAVPFISTAVWLISALLSLLGDDRDPEKVVHDKIKEVGGDYGDYLDQVVRYGITGAAGVDISGSLSIGVGIPRNAYELFGIAGGLTRDFEDVIGYIETGQPWRAIEKALPTGLSGPLRALRESEGLVTSQGRAVWDADGKPYIPSGMETALRIIGFRSAKAAKLASEEWESKREENSFKNRRDVIYKKYRAIAPQIREAYYSKVELSESLKNKQKSIADSIVKYNTFIKVTGRQNTVPFITSESLKNQLKRMVKPTKKERGRHSGNKPAIQKEKQPSQLDQYVILKPNVAK